MRPSDAQLERMRHDRTARTGDELEAISEGFGWPLYFGDGQAELVHPQGQGKFRSTTRPDGLFAGWKYRGSGAAFRHAYEVRAALGLVASEYDVIHTRIVRW